MAAATKPGALHYALVFFVVTAAVEGLVIYSYVYKAADRLADKAKAEEEVQKLNKAHKNSQDNIAVLKKLIGSKFEEVGDPVANPGNKATVAGGLVDDLQTFGKDLATATVLDTMRRLRETLDAVSADRDSKATKIQEQEKYILALKGQYQAQVDNYDTERKSSEQAKRNAIESFDAKNGEKDRQAQALRGELQNVRLELDKERDDRDKERKESSQKQVQLENLVRHQADKIDNLEKLSFEAPKGMITNVEHTNSTVLLNIGEADFLRPRMTFSVYAKENQGVGRGAEDIKGKIEVIKIIGPHMSVAMITDEDIYRPMVAQDLIYTPIWTPGMVEKISVIGRIDLDNDGREDREQFHQLLKSAGCTIDNEVDDNGNRTPDKGQITVSTRFLVKGEIPDRSEAQTPEQQELADKFIKVYKEMEDEARRNGVRVVKLNDFLAYTGFTNKRRMYLPGSHRHFDLKVGTINGGGSAGSVDRTSNGNVSAVFKKGRKAPQEVSNGSTSGMVPSAGQ